MCIRDSTKAAFLDLFEKVTNNDPSLQQDTPEVEEVNDTEDDIV